MTTKKLSARQAHWTEFLSQYDFKLIYCEGKVNTRADTLSYIENNVREQDKVMAEQRMQVLLPRDKIDSRVIEDLQLAPLE